MVKGHYNPAFAGGDNQTVVSALYRFQWTGVQHAPHRIILNGQLPVNLFNRTHGVGISAYRTTAGSLRNSLLAAQYSYIIPTRVGDFHLGLQAGVYDLSFNEGSAHVTGDRNNGAMPSYVVDGVKKQIIDLTAGIAWLGNKGWAGLSLLHLNKPTFYTVSDTIDLQADSLQAFIPPTIHLMAGYNIQLFHPLTIQPMIWWKLHHNTSQVQTTLRAVIADRISGGVSWRLNDGYGLFAGLKLEGLEVVYGYDRHTQGMGRLSRGSHEVSLRYRFHANQSQPSRQLQKSIRLL